MRLVSQKGEGYGLAWSPVKEGLVASCTDHVVSYWYALSPNMCALQLLTCDRDIKQYVKGKTNLDAAAVFTGHTDTVGVRWYIASIIVT